MKVKNLMIGNISKIEYKRIPGEDYYPSSEDTIGNVPIYQDNSLFYRVGNYAFDLIGSAFYRVVRRQETYPGKLRNKKVAILEMPFSNLSNKETISRNEAILVYENKKSSRQ